MMILSEEDSFQICFKWDKMIQMVKQMLLKIAIACKAVMGVIKPMQKLEIFPKVLWPMLTACEILKSQAGSSLQRSSNSVPQKEISPKRSWSEEYYVTWPNPEYCQDFMPKSYWSKNTVIIIRIGHHSVDTDG